MAAEGEFNGQFHWFLGAVAQLPWEVWGAGDTGEAPEQRPGLRNPASAVQSARLPVGSGPDPGARLVMTDILLLDFKEKYVFISLFHNEAG